MVLFKGYGGKAGLYTYSKVLAKEKPHQYTLFEFFLHPALYELLSGEKITKDMPDYRLKELQMKAYANAGYDYITFHACPITFPTAAKEQKKTISLNQGAVISSYEDYERYPWPDPSSYDYSLLDYLASRKPEGMGLIPYGRRCFGERDSIGRIRQFVSSDVGRAGFGTSRF